MVLFYAERPAFEFLCVSMLVYDLFSLFILELFSVCVSERVCRFYVLHTMRNK